MPRNALTDALGRGVEYTRNALADAKARPRNALLDYARGAGMGMSTDILGYPVDVMTMALRPFGYDVEQPVGGSEWLANRLTSPTGSPAEMAGRVTTGMMTPGPEDMLRLAGYLPQKVPVNELITYHGSPHRINNVTPDAPYGKFDLSKVGTGEGVQAYGHGIYLAENPNVARQYANNLQTVTADGNVLDMDSVSQSGWHSNNQTAWAAKEISEKGYDKVLAEAEAAAKADDMSPWAAQWLDEVRALKGKQTAVNKHFYTVDLDDNAIASMLDWDAPLSEQPEAVKAALRDVVLTDDGYTKQTLGDMIDAMEAAPYLKNRADHPRVNLSGAEIYSLVADQAKLFDPKDAKRTFGLEKEFASKALRERGIPGIKYFDGGSRAAGEGTRNFVIFDPEVAKILKRE